MKFTRNASARWNGGKEGKGTLSTQSGAIKEMPYTFKMRFGSDPGTNPEELIGAAHSGCFSMQLAIFLEQAGFKPESLDTTADVTIEDGTITIVKLNLTGDVPGISAEQFSEIANKAKETCPVSKVLNAEIILTEKLV
jgi:lipoyl-dependent peroxiredoxin